MNVNVHQIHILKMLKGKFLGNKYSLYFHTILKLEHNSCNQLWHSKRDVFFLIENPRKKILHQSKKNGFWVSFMSKYHGCRAGLNLIPHLRTCRNLRFRQRNLPAKEPNTRILIRHVPFSIN